MLSIALMFLVYVNSATVPNNSIKNRSIETFNENNFNKIATNQSQVCFTDACFKETERVLYSLDQSIDPCDDFYTFACGNFEEKIDLPDDRNMQTEFTLTQRRVDKQVETMLTEEIQINDIKPFKLAKTFMKSCMDEKTLNENGITPMIDILEKYGGWPVVKGDKWDGEKWDWLEISEQISSDGFMDLILDCHIEVEPKNSSKRILIVNRAEFGLTRRALVKGLEHPSVIDYYNYMVDAATLFGANQTNAKIEMYDVLHFEIAFSQMVLTEDELDNLTTINNPFTIKQIQEKYPYMNWLDYFNRCTRELVHIDEKEVIIVVDEEFLQKLDHFMKSTPKRTVANYFAWRVVLFGSNLLNDNLYNLNRQFYDKSEIDSSNRLVECVKFTAQYLQISVGAMYVRRYFHEKSKQTAIAIVKSIHETFISNLKTVSWMDQKSRYAAIAKAEAMHFHIGYPDELMDDKKLEEYHHNLELEPDSLLHSVIRIRQFSSDRTLSKLREGINKTDWEVHSNPTKVGGFYSISENSILLPAATLQESFFSNDRPSYLNFGGIGWFVAHEITHGFDATGRQFDQNGNLVDWWDKDTVAKFTSKTHCFTDQYSRFKHPDLDIYVNGVRTLDENIADNGGIKGMYAAYQNFVEKNGPDLLLPRLNYTTNQLFWISAAQTWCAVTRSIFDVLFYQINEHAPNRFRVLGSFSNIQNFSNDFNCLQGSRMNPGNKCKIW